jgi:hypothetical protein
MGPLIALLQAAPTALRRLLRPAAALLILFMTAVLGGCGGSQQPGGAVGTTATTAAPASTAGAPTTSEPVELADGRHPVYLKSVDPGQQTVTFDLIQFFTGDAATKAAAEDNKESPPPNDYYIRNVNPQAAHPARAAGCADHRERARRPVHRQHDQGRVGDPGQARQLLPKLGDAAVLDHRGAGPGDQDRPAVPALTTTGPTTASVAAAAVAVPPAA